GEKWSAARGQRPGALLAREPGRERERRVSLRPAAPARAGQPGVALLPGTSRPLPACGRGVQTGRRPRTRSPWSVAEPRLLPLRAQAMARGRGGLRPGAGSRSRRRKRLATPGDRPGRGGTLDRCGRRPRALLPVGGPREPGRYSLPLV